MKTPVRLSALRQPRPYKLRLVDAVTLAALGLLVLKLSAMAVEEAPPPNAPLPDFARVLAKARTGYEPLDPTTTGSVTPKEVPTSPDAKAEPSPAKPPPPPETIPASERAILERLSARRDALKQRTDSLDLREQMLGTAERKLEEGVYDLKRTEDRGEGGTAQRAETERTALKNIVTMYETMKPKDAARVFDRLSLDVLVPIVVAMNPRKMAEVLALMQSEPAEKLTVALSARARGERPAMVSAPVAGLPANELQAIEPPGRTQAPR